VVIPQLIRIHHRAALVGLHHSFDANRLARSLPEKPGLGFDLTEEEEVAVRRQSPDDARLSQG
jgi:hypothetical protein